MIARGEAQTTSLRRGRQLIVSAITERDPRRLQSVLADSVELVLGDRTVRSRDAVIASLGEVQGPAIRSAGFFIQRLKVCTDGAFEYGVLTMTEAPDSTGAAPVSTVAYALRWFSDSAGIARITQIELARNVTVRLALAPADCESLGRSVLPRRPWALTVVPIGPQTDPIMTRAMRSAAQGQGFEPTETKIRTKRPLRPSTSIDVSSIIVTAQMRIAPYVLELGGLLRPVRGGASSINPNMDDRLTQSYQTREVFGLVSWANSRFRAGAGPTFVSAKFAASEEWASTNQGTWPYSHQFQGPFSSTAHALGATGQAGLLLARVQQSYLELLLRGRITQPLRFQATPAYTGGSSSTGLFLGLSCGVAF